MPGKAFKIFLLPVVAAVLAVSCRAPDGRPVEQREVREVRDDIGRMVTVDNNVERVVSLAPNLTEMIFAVGAGDKLVGVTTYCNFPEEAAAVEKIGDTQTPNVERIVALRPDMVFVSTDSQLEAFSKTFDQQGIAMYVVKTQSLADLYDDVRTIGELLGTPQAAIALAAELERRSADVNTGAQAFLGDKPVQKVFVQISNEPLFTIGKDSFLTELVERAGGISVTKDVPTGYPKLSKETAAALNPDVIILSDSEDNREPNAALKDSNAVKNSHVYRINADILSRPGPRLVDALEQIGAKLRPPQ